MNITLDRELQPLERLLGYLRGWKVLLYTLGLIICAYLFGWTESEELSALKSIAAVLLLGGVGLTAYFAFWILVQLKEIASLIANRSEKRNEEEPLVHLSPR